MTEETTKEQQQQAFEEAVKRASVIDRLRALAISRGGTGALRKPLSEREYHRHKKRRQMVKAARKANR